MMVTSVSICATVSICGGCGTATTAFEIPYGKKMKVGSKFYMQGECIHCKHIQLVEVEPRGDY